MPRYRITVSSRSGEDMLNLVRKHRIRVLDHGARTNAAGEFVAHAFADDAQIAQLRQAGYAVEQHEDVDATGRARQQEVGRGDRYAKS